MAWPKTGSGSVATGYVASGSATTIKWGTDGLYGVFVVLSASQNTLQESIKLPNGSGLTTGRVQLIDGATWNLKVRDDTNITAPLNVGNTITITDMQGLFVAPGGTLTARVVDANYETAVKQPGERTIVLEKLTLFNEV